MRLFMWMSALSMRGRIQKNIHDSYHLPQKYAQTILLYRVMLESSTIPAAPDSQQPWKSMTRECHPTTPCQPGLATYQATFAQHAICTAAKYPKAASLVLTLSTVAKEEQPRRKLGDGTLGKAGTRTFHMNASDEHDCTISLWSCPTLLVTGTPMPGIITILA